MWGQANETYHPAQREVKQIPPQGNRSSHNRRQTYPSIDGYTGGSFSITRNPVV
jgi:hypothetical protein